MGAILSFVVALVKLTHKAADFIDVVSDAEDGTPSKFVQVYRYLQGKFSSASGTVADMMDRLGPRYGLDTLADTRRSRRRTLQNRLSVADLARAPVSSGPSPPPPPQSRVWRHRLIGLAVIYVLVQVGLGVYHYQSAAGPVADKNAEYARIRQGCIDNPVRYSMPKSKCSEADAWAESAPSPRIAGVAAAWNNMRVLIFTSLPTLSLKEIAVLTSMVITVTILIAMIVNVISHLMRGTMILAGYTDSDVADMMRSADAADDSDSEEEEEEEDEGDEKRKKDDGAPVPSVQAVHSDTVIVDRATEESIVPTSVSSVDEVSSFTTDDPPARDSGYTAPASLEEWRRVHYGSDSFSSVSQLRQRPLVK